MNARTTTIPYFKLDTGRFLADTSGFSAAHIGYYSQLLVHYWEKDGNLPPLSSLKRKLYVNTDEQAKILEEVLAEFFPDDKSDYLDSCLKEVKEAREKQAANGRASAAARRAKAEEKTDEETPSDSDIDF